MSTLNANINSLRKKFGDRIIRSASEIPTVRRIPLRELPVFDYVSCGGLLLNRINEFVGENGSLKSWAMYRYIAAFQKIEWSTFTLDALTRFTYNKDGSIKDFRVRSEFKGKIKDPVAKRVVLIDVEGTYTAAWGEKMGIDNKGLIIVRPDRLSSAVDIAETFLADPDISLVCLDSMSAVGTDAEIDNDMEKDQMGSAPRFWNKAIRKLQSALNRNENDVVTLLVINSEYESMDQYKPDSVRNGGQLKRSKSLSVKFRAQKDLEQKVDDKTIMIGKNVVLKTLKNKGGGPSGRTANFFYGYEDFELTAQYGTDVISQILELATKHGFITRSGAVYTYGKYKATGFAKFVTMLGETEAFNELRKQVYAEIINCY